MKIFRKTTPVTLTPTKNTPNRCQILLQISFLKSVGDSSAAWWRLGALGIWPQVLAWGAKGKARLSPPREGNETKEGEEGREEGEGTGRTQLDCGLE